MILKDDGDVETESESDDDPMYLVDGKLMVARRASETNLNIEVTPMRQRSFKGKLKNSWQRDM